MDMVKIVSWSVTVYREVIEKENAFKAYYF